MQGVYRNYLDFEPLETGNEKTLVLVDSSSYMQEPEAPLIEVYLPGFNKYLLRPFIAKQVNTYNSNTLGLTQSLQQEGITILPDGVWRIRYKICPYDLVFIDKTFMRVTVLLNKLAMVYNNIDLQACPGKTTDDLFHQLAYVNILIEGAKAAACVDEKKAMGDYNTANKIVNELLGVHCKSCKTF